MTDSEKLRAVMTACSLPLHGVCAFGAVEGHVLSCRAAQRLRETFPREAPARTVIAALFPYCVDDRHTNLSRYARVPDYHCAAGGVLAQAAARLESVFPKRRFLSFIDNSPIPEVRAAALAGLGCVGDNGLLIHPEYGSWVFIGTIVTDLSLPHPTPEIARCPHCGRCAAACPGHCLGGAPGSRETCVSRLSQKKGALTDEQAALLRAGGTAWGCDICQEVCPLNRGARIAPHPCFGGEYTPSLTRESLTDLEGKAYGWRGRAVLERNLSLIDGLGEKQYNNKE